MKGFVTTLVLLSSLFISAITFAAPNETQDVKALQAAYYQWIEDVTTAKGNPNKIIQLYAPDAILLATLKAKPLKTPQDIKNYFVKFTSLKDLRAETDQLITQTSGDFGINSGLYTFHYLDKNDKPVSVEARFTFVYEKKGDKWLILKHHSSKAPNT